MFQRPSVLYALHPCGIGTPYVESLASYVTRLAEAHVVSVWRLILQILAESRPGRVSRCSLRYVYPANGLGKDSEVILRSLEAATERSHPRPLTHTTPPWPTPLPAPFCTPEA